MNSSMFYISIGLTEIVGLMLLGKEFFFPSELRRKNPVMRSVISSIGGTILLTGLMLAYRYQQARATSLYWRVTVHWLQTLKSYRQRR